jgi:macrolide transport system ATP-binding/permease protein
LLFARWISQLCVVLIPDRVGSVHLNLSLDGRVLAFTCLASIGSALLFGLAPAWQTTRFDLAPTLKESARDVLRGRQRFWFGKGLAAAQVALSLILLIGAGLFARTFQKLKTLNPGFASDNVLLFTLDTRMQGSSPDGALNLFGQLLERISNVPGVVSATVSRDGGFGGGGRTKTTLDVEGFTSKFAGDSDVFDVPAGPRFFETFGMPLVQGREFTLQDDQRAPKVSIINEAVARHFFGDANPIGRRCGDTIVIGVAKDAKLDTLREGPPRIMYRSFLQSGPPRRMTFAIRTLGAPMSMLNPLRRELDAYEPNLPLFGFTTLKEVVERSLAQERLFAALSSLFGILALILAAVGLYGVMSFSVAQRTREIGLRVALGAESRNVVALVVGQGMRVVLGGLAVGFIGAFALTRFIASRLYGITPMDPLVVAGVSVLLGVVALLACYIPACRAARVDPMEALRNE